MTDPDRNPAALSATEICNLLGAGSLTPDALLDCAAARHGALDGELNALPTLCIERARKRAGAMVAPLNGIPVAVKDLTAVEGVRTTYGSRIFADHVPDASDYVVQRLEASGGLVFAKSNTPEFGCGGVTFNDVFGQTRNPWNTDYTPGGSSGGSAAALASGQAWLALGSDFGGSLRIPASFCGVVGLRPTPGCIPRGPATLPFDRHWVEGPMARSVADVALLLDALTGHDPRDPLSARPGPSAREAVMSAAGPVRVASVGGMGLGRVEAAVSECVERALGTLQRTPGWEVSRCELDLSAAREVFAIRRGQGYAAMFGEFRRDCPELLRDDIVNDLDRGLAYTAGEIARADRLQGDLWRAAAPLLEEFDVIACPTVAVAPFRMENARITRIAGEEAPTYYDWLRQTFSLSLLGVPSISIPCGFTADGLPIGLQLAGPPHAEARLLQIAAAVEARLDVFNGVNAPWQR